MTKATALLCGPTQTLAIPDAQTWNAAYEARWGPLGPQSKAQIANVLHDKNGRYDDSEGVFAWVVSYWLRAWVGMAKLTGDRAYMDTSVSFIDTMFDRTDARRIARGEIEENYIRDPGYFRGTGHGGPFWKRGREATVVTNGQIAQGIMCFVDAVYADPKRWQRYREKADTYFRGAKAAIDAFDNDWQNIGEAGCYHYRDSEGSGILGTTPVAFNQAAAMMTAQIFVNRWEPSPARLDKIRRLVRYWLNDYMVENPDGTLTWRYIAKHPTLTATEDVGHGSIDVEFLVAAYLTGETALEKHHITALAKTFATQIYNGKSGLNEYVDGTTTPGFDENWNAAIGWVGLSRWDAAVAEIALEVYNASYPPSAPGGILWSRPMLGWANLIGLRTACVQRSDH